jgi:hypothetical protein
MTNSPGDPASSRFRDPGAIAKAGAACEGSSALMTLWPGGPADLETMPGNSKGWELIGNRLWAGARIMSLTIRSSHGT